MSRNDIEERLKNLIEESSSEHTECGTSKCYRVFTIIGFLLMALGIASAYLRWMEWISSKKNYTDLEPKINIYKKNLTDIQAKVRELENEYNEMGRKIENATKETESYKVMIESLKNKTTNIVKRLAEMRTLLEKVIRERNTAKTNYTEIRSKYDNLIKEFKSLTETMKTLNATLENDVKAVTLWKVISGIGFGLGSLEAITDIVFHYLGNTRQAELQRSEERSKSYPTVANSFENYAVLSRDLGKSVHRTICFHNGIKTDLKNCDNKKPVVVTISTYKGFTFAIYLDIGWNNAEGNHEDPNSFIVSINRGNIAKITEGAHALTISKNSMMEFGNSGIIISSDGQNGTARANAYHIPSEFTPENFLTGNATFNIMDLKIEEVVIS